MQRLRQTLGANLTPEQADVQAREQVGAKSGPGRDQVTPEVTPEVTPQVRRVAFRDMKGFSCTNLMCVRAFVEAWPAAEIIQQAVGQFPWGHNLPSIERFERELGSQ